MTDHLFKTAEHAALYSKFRPTPPGILIERIVKLAVSKKDLLDVGCGSGQGTRPMTKFFENVTGTDLSEAQIEEAKRQCAEAKLNIDFRVSSACTMSFPDESFDVITGSQCVHWFNTDLFYKECLRVLRKNGILAMYGYKTPVPCVGKADVDAEAAQLIHHYDKVTINDYWDVDRSMIDEGYNNLPAPGEGFVLADRDDKIIVEPASTLSKYISYLRSWSPYQKYIRLNPENTSDVLDDLEAKLQKALGVDSEAPIKLRINFFLVAYKKL